MPEVIHASYNQKGHKFQPEVIDSQNEDVFVLENLLETGFENYDNATSLDESHMMAVLECLSQLHGTGMAYKLFSVSEDSSTNDITSNAQNIGIDSKRMSKLKEEFPVLEEQIQLRGRCYNTKHVLQFVIIPCNNIKYFHILFYVLFIFFSQIYSKTLLCGSI
jgi:hypothetical protein